LDYKVKRFPSELLTKSLATRQVTSSLNPRRLQGKRRVCLDDVLGEMVRGRMFLFIHKNFGAL
jgi:hypothetical protein